MLAIGLSGRYVCAREELRASIPTIYAEVNQKYFEGKLEDVSITVSDLRKLDDGNITVGVTNFGERTTIEIDLYRIEDERELRETISHEACHVYEGPDSGDHGVSFQACMLRFN